MVNFTSDVLQMDNSTHYTGYEGDWVRMIAALASILPIAIINGLFLTAIMLNRRKAWVRQIHYTICLIVSDFLIGLINTAIGVNRYLPFRYRKIEVCIFLEYLFIATQMVSVMHIFAVCVDRFFKIKNISTVQNIRKISAWMVSIFIWIFTIVVFAVPYLMFSKTGLLLKACNSLTRIFNDTPVNAYPYLAFLIVTPWISTNLLYLVECLLLAAKLKRVGPVSGSITINVTESQSVPSTMKSDNLNLNTIRKNNNLTPGQCSSKDRTEIRPTDQSNALGRIRQNANKTVLQTIGALLLVLNGSVWPLIIIFIGKMFSPDFDMRPEFLLLLFLNQVVNPFVYTWRVPKLRHAIAELLRKMCRMP